MFREFSVWDFTNPERSVQRITKVMYLEHLVQYMIIRFLGPSGKHTTLQPQTLTPRVRAYEMKQSLNTLNPEPSMMSVWVPGRGSLPWTKPPHAKRHGVGSRNRVQIVIYLSSHLSVDLSIYLYIYICVCVCLYMYLSHRERERGERQRQREREIEIEIERERD